MMDSEYTDDSLEQAIDFDYVERLALWLPGKLSAARQAATYLPMYAIVFLTYMLLLPATAHRDYVSVEQSIQMAVLACIVWLPCGVLLFAASSSILAYFTSFVADNMRTCSYLVHERVSLSMPKPSWIVCRVLGVDTSSGHADTPEREGLAALNEYYGCCFRHGRSPFPWLCIQAEVVSNIVFALCGAALLLYTVRHSELIGSGALAEAIYVSFVGILAISVLVALSSVRSAAFLTALSRRLEELLSMRHADEL